jgi:N-methylhydantoinase A
MDFLRSAAEVKVHFRASTTIWDAFIDPLVNRQPRSICKRLKEDNVGAKVVAMRSNGGEMMLDAVAEAPIQIAVSGPAGESAESVFWL